MKHEKPLTVFQAVEFIEKEYGETYHYNTVYRWLGEGILKGFRRGKKGWRITKQAIRDFFCPENNSQTKAVCLSKEAA